MSCKADANCSRIAGAEARGRARTGVQIRVAFEFLDTPSGLWTRGQLQVEGAVEMRTVGKTTKRGVQVRLALSRW